jgi:hypothetical protein
VDPIKKADLTGIDCPFGRPEPFREFIAAQGQVAEGAPLDAPVDLDSRRKLAYRQTDIYVGQQIARKAKKDNEWAHMPLSVSTNFLGLTAMRMASLSAKLAKAGITIDKSGSTGKGYKGAKKRETLGALVDRLRAATKPWLKQDKDEWDLCRKWDDVFDALIASLKPEFRTAGHLASWAGVCPGSNESAGRVKSTKTRPGNPYLKGALGTAALAATRSKNTYLAAKYRRIASRRGPMKAIVAVEHSMLIAIRHMLTDATSYQDPGADYYTRPKPERAKNRAIDQLRQLGYNLDLTPVGAAVA